MDGADFQSRTQDPTGPGRRRERNLFGTLAAVDKVARLLGDVEGERDRAMSDVSSIRLETAQHIEALTERLATAEAERLRAQEQGEAIARRASEILRGAEQRLEEALARIARLEEENSFLLDLTGKPTGEASRAAA